MAKQPEMLENPPEPLPALQRRFRDKHYTSRTLVLPDSGRTLAVAQGHACVLATDKAAVDYLEAHHDFEPLKE